MKKPGTTYLGKKLLLPLGKTSRGEQVQKRRAKRAAAKAIRAGRM